VSISVIHTHTHTHMRVVYMSVLACIMYLIQRATWDIHIFGPMSLCMFMYMYIYIYIICTHAYIHTQDRHDTESRTGGNGVLHCNILLCKLSRLNLPVITHVYTYIYIHTHTYMYIYIYIYTYIYKHACVHVGIYLFI
jgi:hypothetical protein